ncbi:DUF1604 hypothetical protein [Helicosporidium sp. ATCC 50920]|nr:DUF1604 hypothetical protein [Helicosporidium sp. ATCC 50920]|eukprot:KDD76790.1 DUF1604 hypothetical protein [Helicosporidium sp. ATCC 50920]
MSTEEEYHYWGTPISDDLPTQRGPQDAATTRSKPAHLQEVTDAQGRRRFHGAFTGGFSAGYYNTVGSRDGWAPSAFKSTRNERNTIVQHMEQFMDEDELEEHAQKSLQVIGAEEFRRAKALDRARALAASDRRTGRGIAFGTGALDEDDAEGILEDYVTQDAEDAYEEAAPAWAPAQRKAPVLRKAGLGDFLSKHGYHFELQEEEEAEPAPRLGAPARPLLLTEAAGTSRDPSRSSSSELFLPGFRRARRDDPPEIIPPLTIPHAYDPADVASRVQVGVTRAEALHAGPAPPATSPPASPRLRQAIDLLALHVARFGRLSEEVSRAEQASGGGHAFLLGGEGAAYYRHKVHVLASLLAARPDRRAPGQRAAPLGVEDRAALLGEESIPAGGEPAGKGRPANASPSSAAASPSPAAAPMTAAIAEADRARLKEQMARTFAPGAMEGGEGGSGAAERGGLRPGARPSSSGPEAGEDARRRIVTAADLSRPMAAAEKVADASARGLPVRRVVEWRPAPLVCKRFNVPDPYKNKPAPVEVSKTRTDFVALPETDAASRREVEAPGSTDRAPDEGESPALAADAFLAELGAEGALFPAGPGSHPAAPGGSSPPAAVLLEDATGAPINLLQAIFDASSDEEDVSCGNGGSEEAVHRRA